MRGFDSDFSIHLPSVRLAGLKIGEWDCKVQADPQEKPLGGLDLPIMV